MIERTLFPLDDEPAPVVRPRSGRDEMNLAEYPLSLLADRAPKGQKTLEYENPHGGKLTITGSDAYGLPTAGDTDILIGLIQLTRLRNNFTAPKVQFTRYELLKLMGWPDESKYYKRVDDSLNRWVGVTLFYDNAWWDNRAKRYLTAKLHIIESVIIDDERPAKRTKGSSPLSSFTWNAAFIESCQADNLKRLDLDRYFGFRSAVSKRVYRFLDKRFYVRPEWTFDLKEFAFEHVGLSRTYAANAGKIKEKLQPAIDELEEVGFLKRQDRNERYRKNGHDWTIRLVRSHDAPVLAEPPTPEPNPLVSELVKRGVTEATAVELVDQHAPEAITAKLDVFDWLVGRGDRKIKTNPAGYLVESIRKDYAPPKGYESSADRERRTVAAQANEKAAAEQRRKTLDAKTQAVDEAEAVEHYWNALTADQQAKLEAEALESVEPEQWENCHGKPVLERIFRRTAREDHIKRLLKAV